MARFDYDLFVLGAGSGGVRAARLSAGFGARVAVAEKGDVGGTCVNVGCVPKKLFVYGSEYAATFEDARGYGYDVEVRGFDWPTLVLNKDREIARLQGVYERLLGQSGVHLLRGPGKLLDPHTVDVGGKRFTAEHVLVATGSRPTRPHIPGGDLGLTSNEIFFLETLPRSIAITGAGYISLEFASIFRGLGVDVHVVHRGGTILRGFDADVRAHVEAELRKIGVNLHLAHPVRRIDRVAEGYSLLLDDGSRVVAEQLMHAIGRVPNTAELGLEALGVAMNERGGMLVDRAYRSSVPSILAIGDVIDHIQLTPVALAEGTWLARTLFGGMDLPPLDYRSIPTAVFSHPTVATVGLTEEQARESHDVVVFRSTFKPMRHTMSGRDEKMLMKLVVDAATDRVLGCHVVGPDAGEIVQGFAVAMTCGATKAQLDATIGIHPTAAEELVTMRTPV